MREVCEVVHGDDIFLGGPRSLVDAVLKSLRKRCETREQMMGARLTDAIEIVILNRRVQWTEEGLRISLDPRHVQATNEELAQTKCGWRFGREEHAGVHIINRNLMWTCAKRRLADLDSHPTSLCFYTRLVRNCPCGCRVGPSVFGIPRLVPEASSSGRRSRHGDSVGSYVPFPRLVCSTYICTLIKFVTRMNGLTRFPLFFLTIQRNPSQRNCLGSVVSDSVSDCVSVWCVCCCGGGGV